MRMMIVLLVLVLSAPAGAQVPRDDPGAVQDPYPEDVAEADRAAAGAALARYWCAECHAVAPDPDRGSDAATTDAAPPFIQVARMEDDALRAFLSQPHPPMPPLTLANDEIDDLVAYFATLRTRP